MAVEQSRKLIEKFNKMFVEEYNIMTISNSMQNITYPNIPYIYARLYGHVYKMVFLVGHKIGSDELSFIRGTNSDGKDSNFEVHLKGMYSFLDTCDNMGVDAFVTNLKCFYITEIGMIGLTAYDSAPRTRIYDLSDIRIYADDEESAKKLFDTFIEKAVLIEESNNSSKNTKNVKYLWLKNSPFGIATNELSFPKMDIDLNKNYNNDLPYNKIKELLNSDKSELILLDGKPGTGKTTLIKKLMGDINTQFFYVNTSFILSVEPTKFVEYLLDKKSPIVVFEDCEKLLLEREQGNVFMEVLLNLTDGILGDSVKPKFICSFNCSEKKVDKALLRRGRLSLKYTFNELSLEKTRKLLPDADKPLTLADIYNHEVENVVGAMEYSRVGF